MASKFANVPSDSDTTVLLSVEAVLGEYDILYQMWICKDVTAQSFIFSNDDIKNLAEDEIIKLAKSSPLIETDSKITFSKQDSGYTFINFNFVAKE